MNTWKVDPYEGELRQGTAYWMARISEETYRSRGEDNRPDESAILDALQDDDPGFESVRGASRKSSQGIVVEHKQYLTIAYRGTDEWKDWLDNIDIGERKGPDGTYHEGFYEATEDIWEEMRDAVDGARARQKARGEPKRPVFITGHSLGGAMATVTAGKLVHEDFPFTAVYTFGQPRAVDAKTARDLNVEMKDRYWRFCNDLDIVTRIPSRLAGFRHVGSVVYIDHDGRIEPKLSRWQQFLNRVEGVVEETRDHGLVGLGRSVKEYVRDHDVKRYRRLIERCEEWPVG